MRHVSDLPDAFFETLINFVLKNTDYRINFLETNLGSQDLETGNLVRMSFQPWVTVTKNKRQKSNKKYFVEIFDDLFAIKSQSDAKQNLSSAIRSVFLSHATKLDNLIIQIECFEIAEIRFKGNKVYFSHKNPTENKAEEQLTLGLSKSLNRIIERDQDEVFFIPIAATLSGFSSEKTSSQSPKTDTDSDQTHSHGYHSSQLLSTETPLSLERETQSAQMAQGSSSIQIPHPPSLRAIPFFTVPTNASGRSLTTETKPKEEESTKKTPLSTEDSQGSTTVAISQPLEPHRPKTARPSVVSWVNPKHATTETEVGTTQSSNVSLTLNRTRTSSTVQRPNSSRSSVASPGQMRDTQMQNTTPQVLPRRNENASINSVLTTPRTIGIYRKPEVPTYRNNQTSRPKNPSMPSKR